MMLAKDRKNIAMWRGGTPDGATNTEAGVRRAGRKSGSRSARAPLWATRRATCGPLAASCAEVPSARPGRVATPRMAAGPEPRRSRSSGGVLASWLGHSLAPGRCRARGPSLAARRGAAPTTEASARHGRRASRREGT